MNVVLRQKKSQIFSLKMIEGGVDMGTSTGDITHHEDSNNHRPQSGSGEIILSTENLGKNGGETSVNQSGNLIILIYSQSEMIFFSS